MKYVFALILVITLLAPNQLAAQSFDEVGLAIRPAIIDVGGAAGSTVEAEVQIENISEDIVAVEVGSKSLLPNDPEIDQSRRGDFDASQWIQPLESSFILERGEIDTTTIQINIPDSAGPGGHYALSLIHI